MIKRGSISTFIVYSLGFLLLWEWLRPLDQITDIGKIHYFVFFIAFILLLNLLKIHSSVGFILKCAALYYFLFAIFGAKESSVFLWGKILIKDTYGNILLLLKGQIYGLTDLFRSLLFFILLWIMTYLLQYWLVINKRVFIFYIMTIIYVGVLDTFTSYNGETAIMRIVAIGFILLGILFFQRLLNKEDIENRKRLFFKWMIPLTTMIIVSVLVGYMSPKAGPIWPDPVPFIQSKAENVLPRDGKVSKIGYGQDDTKLGGPFLSDDTVVFEAITYGRQYWRVETKDVYTGKGWTTSTKEDPQGEIRSGDIIPLDIQSDNDEPIKSALLSMKLQYPHIVIPYGFLSVNGNENGFFRYDPTLTKLLSYQSDGTPNELEEYEVQFNKTAFSLNELRNTNRLPNTSQFDGMNMVEQYTQLPENFPSRVKMLAEEITAEVDDNWFDQAKAIEKYFKNGEFTYDDTDVAVPEKNQDYVEQFLFETKRGYCDNFSTSMVTLLRSIGIPARWAKGYAPGNYVGVVDAQHSLYEITNNDAHSWVEVFFPTEGWVPFEPTIGFSNTVHYLYDEDRSDAPVTSNENNNEPEALEKEEKNEVVDKEETKEKEEATSTTAPKNNTLSFNYWIYLLIILGGIIMITSLVYWKRAKWIPYYLIWKFKKKNNKETLIIAYDKLSRQLERIDLKRGKGQTLRDYAFHVDNHFNTQEMSILTERYERAIYRGDLSESDWSYTRKLWENLVKKSTG
ncbi:transglutaminase TgpA family protein [Bacillus niameyensis]|uniref:transglutaminase TgpA family protein n=1 Tax=Bacillus niameyensis TaxID=1522308 RepID=UPI00078650C9|nr:transglutaminaseTgpA domain-containing protein [Bacillus niameyensis]